MTTTFKVGDIVSFAPMMGYFGTYEVLDVIDVLPGEVEYDPATKSGGVGHHQWVVIETFEGDRRRFSGKYFEPHIGIEETRR